MRIFNLRLLIIGAVILEALLFFSLPAVVQAGCCICDLAPVSSRGGSGINCVSGALQLFDCFALCGQTNTPGYPKYVADCRSEPACPQPPEESCCLRIKKIDNTIDQCVGNIFQEECLSDKGFSTTKAIYYKKSCDDVNACQAIGRKYDPDYFKDDEDGEKKESPLIFTPQVTIPGKVKIGGKDFFVNKGEGIVVDGSLIAKYVAVTFQWLLGAVGVVAVAFVAYGGLLWLTAFGNPEAINKARKTILDSLVGVILVAVSYVLLSQINERLVAFKPLKIEKVQRCELEASATTAVPDECQSISINIGSCDVRQVNSANITVEGSHVALYLQPVVADRFEQWMNAFANQTGVTIQVNSMFRTYEYQSCLFEKLGSKQANAPCTSTHEQGRAVDFNIYSLSKEEYNTLKSLGSIYGFLPQNPNQGQPESWHFTYVEDDAKRSVGEVCPDSACRNLNYPPKEGCF